MLVPFLPNTSMSGGQTRWYNIIKYLSKDHEITLFSLIKDESEKRFIPELEKYCKSVRVFYRPKSPWTLRNMILTLFSWYPLLVIRNFSWAERKAIKAELKDNSYDLIHAETFYVMPHIPKGKTPTILVEQTIEYLVYKHYVDTQVPWFARPFFMLDVVKLKFWEKYYWKKTNRLVAVSEADKAKMQEDIPGIEADVIPNGVDVSHFDAASYKKASPPRIVFVGNFKWLQNVEAVDILVDEVWPKIKAQYKNAKLWVVGKSIPPRIVELASQNTDLVLTESIEDIREAYKMATMMVVPLKGPGGTRLKVLEAFASELPVVSTSVGIEGLDITPGVHALVAETPAELAKEAVGLLKDPKRAVKIGKAGRTYVQDHFGWQAIVKIHDEVYKNALH